MYSISQVAELTGIPLATLRAWEGRYDVVHPRRTPGGFRAYSSADIHVLTTMRELVDAGWAPRHAAEQVRASHSGEGTVATGWVPLTRGSAPGAGAGDAVRSGGGAAADVGVRTRPAELPPDEFIAGAAALDVARVEHALDAGFARGSFEWVVDDWLLPQLKRLGEAWEQGVVGVAGEHLVAHAVGGRLAAAYTAAAAPTSGPSVVIALPPGARHELGLLAFAVAVRRRGLRTTYLGADLPEPAWVAAVTEHRASAAVTAAARVSDAVALAPIVAALHHARPGMIVAVGGRYQAGVDGSDLRLGHSIAAAADRLVRALGDASTDGPSPGEATGGPPPREASPPAR